jgi:very-short-patch-repair endonuclease
MLAARARAARARGRRRSSSGSRRRRARSIHLSRVQHPSRRRTVAQPDVPCFVADFAAASVKLVVEVDGTAHARRVAADGRRDRALARLGWRVLRLPAALVLQQPLAAVALVRLALSRWRGPTRASGSPPPRCATGGPSTSAERAGFEPGRLTGILRIPRCFCGLSGDRYAVAHPKREPGFFGRSVEHWMHHTGAVCV